MPKFALNLIFKKIITKRQFRFWVYLQVYRSIFFSEKALHFNLSLSLSLSLSLPLKSFSSIFTSSLDTLHPCKKWKIPPLKLDFVEFYFFPKNPSILFFLSLPLRLFSSEEFTELFSLLVKTNCIRVKSEKFLRWSWSLSNFVFFFQKIPPFCSRSLSLPLKLFSSEEFTELFSLLVKTNCIRVKSEKFLRWSWSLSNFVFFPKNPSILFALSLSSSKIIFLWRVYWAIFTISLDTLHPCEKWKIPPLKLEFVEFFFPKIPSIFFSLCLFL